MAVSLTQGAITEICRGNCSENLQPVLQVIELKQVQSQQNSTVERYCVVLSDGSFYQQGMLATQKNELIYSGRLQQGAIIRLTQFICNVVQNRKIIIIVDLDVICEKCELIGEPVAAPKGAPAESATGQSGFTFGNLQYLDRSSHSGGMTTIQNLAGQSLDLKPVLQVLELELVNSQQHSASVNFHLVLSDGYHFQQAMLTTQKNQLVRSGKLQKGSIVRLTQFVCNVVQSCKIIMVLDLDVVLEKCELLGQPVAAPAEFATGQPSGFTFGNSQSLNSCSHAGGVSGLANDFSAMNLATGQVTPPAYNPINSSSDFDFGMPTNQVGQRYESQYNNFVSAGAPGSYMSCTNCGGSGHSSLLCPNIRNLPLGSGGGASVECCKCHQSDHWGERLP